MFWSPLTQTFRLLSRSVFRWWDHGCPSTPLRPVAYLDRKVAEQRVLHHHGETFLEHVHGFGVWQCLLIVLVVFRHFRPIRRLRVLQGCQLPGSLAFPSLLQPAPAFQRVRSDCATPPARQFGHWCTAWLQCPMRRARHGVGWERADSRRLAGWASHMRGVGSAGRLLSNSVGSAVVELQSDCSSGLVISRGRHCHPFAPDICP